MTPEMKELYNKFLEIKKKKYIESVGNGFFACGDTFERLLNKPRDELPFADYKGIELKTKAVYSNFPIRLFKSEPDGIYLFANTNLVDKYGYKKKGKNFNFFHLHVTGHKKIKYIKNYFKLKVDYNYKLIRLQIYDSYDNLIDEDTAWSFDLIKEKFKYKLPILAIIRYYPTTRNKVKYFWYYNISFYKDFCFENFLKEIENGNIYISFNFDEFKNGPRKGQRLNHGTEFSINQDVLKNIYKKHYFFK